MEKYVPRCGTQLPDTSLAGLPIWLSQLLYIREVDTDEKAERFLHPSLNDLYDPLIMPGIREASALIKKAIESGDRIVVYGDYDVDGICATAIMLKALSILGSKATAYIPDRLLEGYGLNDSAIKELAGTHHMLITVDCGITSHAEIILAQSLGMTVIITDHHEASQTLPPADAIVHPMHHYPFPGLSGSGVALKLCQALIGTRAALPLFPLCALATVADMMPLADENRVIVRMGLDMMEECEFPGLLALISECDCHFPLTAEHLAYRLAPRLNAAGRLSDARKSLALIMSEDSSEAAHIAHELSQENNTRRSEQERLFRKALDLLPTQVDFKHDKVIIVASDGFSHGLIGLCAGKLCEKYYYPSIVLDRQADGMLVGSARSIKGIHIYKALSACEDLFIHFGGHAMAAGLTMKAENLPALRSRLNETITAIADPSCYIPTKEYDLVMSLDRINEDTVRALSLLEPTGRGNPSPVFFTGNMRVQHVRAVGRDGTHLAVTLSEGSEKRDGIYFSHGYMNTWNLSCIDTLYTPTIHTYQGRQSIQLRIEAIKPVADNKLPEHHAFINALINDFHAWTAYQSQTSLSVVNTPLPYDEAGMNAFMNETQGTLIIARTRETALKYTDHYDTVYGLPADPRGFTCLLLFPDTMSLCDYYNHILLADGVLSADEIAIISVRCPNAILHTPLRVSEAMKANIADLDLSDEAYRALYRRLAHIKQASLIELSKSISVSAQVLDLSLKVFAELNLIKYDGKAMTVLPAHKCVLKDSRLLTNLRNITASFNKEAIL